VGGRVGEAGPGVLGESLELVEVGLGCSGVLLPEVELMEVFSEGVAFVGYLAEGGGELVVVDVASGVGPDNPGFFQVELVESAGDAGPLVGLLGLGVGGGGDVVLGGLAEPVGVGEQVVDGLPDVAFELVGGVVAGVVGAAVGDGNACG